MPGRDCWLWYGMLPFDRGTAVGTRPPRGVHRAGDIPFGGGPSLFSLLSCWRWLTAVNDAHVLVCQPCDSSTRQTPSGAFLLMFPVVRAVTRPAQIAGGLLEMPLALTALGTRPSNSCAMFL